MAFSDWYEVLDKSNAGGVEFLNVYHVERDNVGITAAVIAEAYEDHIFAALLSMQEVNITHTSIEVRSLDDPLDFAVRVPAPGIGTRVGANLTTFNVLSIQMNRTRLDMRNGQKRYTAGLEADTNGVNWLAAFVVEGTTLAAALLQVWVTAAAPATPVCRYGILKRVCSIEPPPDPCTAFRLPEDDLELKFFNPVTAIVRGTIRSQVSRKRLI